MRYAQPGQPGSVVHVSPRYENFIDGKWVPPVKGHYMVDLAPATATPICEVAKSTPEDVETALDAAHHAKDEWGRTSPAERARVLNEIADAIDAHREMLAVAESWENGKPVRETLAADIPLAADHFRYFAAAVRAQQTKITEIDEKTIAYHFHEPLGVVGQIIPFNFPILMAAWKIAPALAAGNCTVIKPASATPWSILKLAEVIGHIIPPGVLNIVTGPGAEIGKALAANPRIAKVAFTGETVTFQEEIFGPVLAVTTFKDEAEALEIANDTPYGLGGGVWTRDGNRAFRVGRGIRAGRVWVNCYHQYPAGAAFGGYKVSGIGRETHQMMLEHYSQTKNLLVSYDQRPLGFF